MSKKAKPQVTTSEPYKGVVPYLTGDAAKGTKGIFPEAQRMFEQGGFNPAMQSAVDLYSGDVMNRATDPANNFMRIGANKVMQGAFDSNFDPIANITTPQINLTAARSGQGVLNPTNAMYKMLSGRPDNPYLDQQASAITNQLTRNLNENVMPGVRSEALASGQYGGSRQGIAEGLAASRLNQDLAPALTGLYGSAFENAQNRMFGTATQLNDQAFQNATNNANRDFSGQQFNANLGLQNNQQQIAKNTSNLNNRMQGMGILSGANAIQDNNFAQYMNAQGAPNQYNWQNLNNYAGIIQPGAGMGSTQSQTMYKNPLGGAMGGALSGAAMGSIVPGIGTGLGALIGGGMGLLGGM